MILSRLTPCHTAYFFLLVSVFFGSLGKAADPSLAPPAWAKRVLFVDADKGRDTNNGQSAETPWKSLHHAAESAQAGDFIQVGPGVYQGGIRLIAKGTAEHPIAFIAQDRGKSATIVSNADPRIRSNQISWQLEDEEMGLYSIPCETGWPARVLYSDNDLFPYASLDELKRFVICGNVPGPRHGYAFDRVHKRLYVRLNANGKYGSTDPSQHVMAVAPSTGGQFDGSFVTDPSHYNIGILGAGPSHIILEGFTFETPGVGGVYVEGDDVRISRCWFRGCRVGVGGNYSDKLPESGGYISYRLNPESIETSAARILIEYCDYSQHPAFQDVVDILEFVGPAKLQAMDRKSKFALIWARKDTYSGGVAFNELKYEMGLAARIGREWTIRRNAIRDSMEGLSCHATNASVGLRVVENIFERICDNGVEAEDHARDLWIEGNLFIDNFEPFSWQPLRGTPWPGPIYVIRNIFVNSEDFAGLWFPVTPVRGAFKIGAKPDQWKFIPHMQGFPEDQIEVPLPGLLIVNNTVSMKNCRLITPQGNPDTPIRNAQFINNVLITDVQLSRAAGRELKEGVFEFSHNAVSPAQPGLPGPGALAAGPEGLVFSRPEDLKLTPEWLPLPDSPLIGRAKVLKNLEIPQLSTIGARQPGDEAFPFSVGPLAP